MQIIDLRTERQCTPIQIDSAHPRFSWRVDTKEQNWYQESYRIQVKNNAKYGTVAPYLVEQ